METISTLPDKFSWRRTLSIGLLFKSSMRLYAIISALISLAALLLVRYVMYIGGNEMGFYTLMSMIVGAALYLSPLAFSRRDDTLMTMLPAKPVEKFVFYLLYILIAIPFIIEVIWYGGDCLYAACTSTETTSRLLMSQLDMNRLVDLPHKSMFVVVSIIQSMAIILTVFYVVLRAARHRVVKALLALVGILFASGLLSAIAGAVVAFARLGDRTDIRPDEIVATINAMYPAFMMIYGLLFVYAIVMLCLCYRRIARGEVRA